MTADAPPATWSDVFAEGRGALLGLICLGVWLNAADSLVTTTIMPSVARDLGHYAFFAWATAAYMLGAILSGATAARFAAWLGLRHAMVAAGAVTAIGCAVSAAAPGMIVLIAGRALQGLGAGWIVGACYAAIGALFPERYLARIFGLMTGIWGVATVLGPLVGGLFGQGGDWRALFWAFGAQCLLFIAAAMALLKAAPRPPGTATPWVQIALVVGGVALIGGADLCRGLVLTLVLCLASLGLFVAAVRAAPASGPGLFPRAAADLKHAVGAGYLGFFCLSASSMGFSVYGPALLQRLYGLSPLGAGYAAGMESFGWTSAALAVAGVAARWYGFHIKLGGVLIVVALALLAWTVPAGPLWALMAAGTVLGAGFGFCYSFISQRILAGAPADERELASAGIPSVRLVGNAAGACLSGVIANLVGFSGGVSWRVAEASGLWLFALAAPIAVIGLVAIWRVADAPGSEPA